MKATRLFDNIHNQFDDEAISRYIGARVDNTWEYYSTGDVIKLARELSSGLIERGVQPNDKIGIVVVKNRPEWVITDLAIQYIGAISVPMYATISPREYEYILNEAQVKMCFVGEGDLYDKLAEAQRQVPSLKDIVCYDKQGGRLFWKDLLSSAHLEKVELLSQQVKAEDLVTIIYTSGTTGNPKGVMLTHTNIQSIVDSCAHMLPIKKGDKVLSFLPICHIFERAILYVYTGKGVEINFTGTDNLGGESGDLADVKPHYFTTVPRLLEKVYEKIYAKGQDLTGIKKKLFFWALALTDHFEHDRKLGILESIQFKIADKLIFSKWRGALGGNVRAIAVGAAACPQKIARVFSAAGIIITEGYGLTETSPVISLNQYDNNINKIGTVGTVLPMMDLVFLDDDGKVVKNGGEIAVNGPNVMIGYYNQPEQTAAVFTEINGKKYFKTGDIGMLVDGPKGNKFLKITDRKKELLKTSGGKYVAPAPIEIGLKEDFLIDQAMVIGDNLKFVSALIIPSREALAKWCEEHQIQWTNLTDAINLDVIKARIQETVDLVNKDLSHTEQIKKFTILPTTWDPTKTDGSDSELTPTMKLKRRVIMQKSREAIEQMYKSS